MQNKTATKWNLMHLAGELLETENFRISFHFNIAYYNINIDYFGYHIGKLIFQILSSLWSYLIPKIFTISTIIGTPNFSDEFLGENLTQILPIGYISRSFPVMSFVHFQ